MEREIKIDRDVLEEVVDAASRFVPGHHVSVSSRAIHELAKSFGVRPSKNLQTMSSMIEVQVGRVTFSHTIGE